MLFTLAAFLSASQPAQPERAQLPGRPAWVVATVAHSEWCPEGNVRLDLRTGEYALTPRAPRPKCRDSGVERPVRTGALGAKRLAALRTAASRAAADGLEAQACRDGGQPETIILSNSGPAILVLATGAAAASAPEDQSCWSKSATALHDLIDETFAPESRG